jgi:hypothetical protein
MRSDKIIYLQWYSDPSHAWLRISRKDAIKLDILDKISAYSYMSEKGQYLYLEEDSDAALALEALKLSPIYLPCYNKTDRHDERSRVRKLPAFVPQKLIRQGYLGQFTSYINR